MENNGRLAEKAWFSRYVSDESNWNARKLIYIAQLLNTAPVQSGCKTLIDAVSADLLSGEYFLMIWTNAQRMWRKLQVLCIYMNVYFDYEKYKNNEYLFTGNEYFHYKR